MKTYHQIIPAVYLIFVRDNQVLLQRRFNTGYEDGNYTLPGGHFDGEEPATKVAIREAKEELGVSLSSKNLQLVHVMHRMSGPEERIDLTFRVLAWKGDPENTEPEKCDHLAWFPLENLPENTIVCIKEVIDSHQNKIFYSEFNLPGKFR